MTYSYMFKSVLWPVMFELIDVGDVLNETELPLNVVVFYFGGTLALRAWGRRGGGGR